MNEIKDIDEMLLRTPFDSSESSLCDMVAESPKLILRERSKFDLSTVLEGKMTLRVGDDSNWETKSMGIQTDENIDIELKNVDVIGVQHVGTDPITPKITRKKNIGVQTDESIINVLDFQAVKILTAIIIYRTGWWIYSWF